MHYYRWKKHGDPSIVLRRRGKPVITDNGYRLLKIPGHPNASKNGYVREHTKVMSDHIGRPLLPTEEVHHRNGVRDDNRIKNLELWTRKHPPGQRVTDKIKWAGELLAQYADDPVFAKAVDRAVTKVKKLSGIAAREEAA